MSDWVITFTFDLDATMDEMDGWETKLEAFDASVARIPGRGVDVTLWAPTGLDMGDALNKVSGELAHVIPAAPVGLQIVTELEHQRRADEPTMPELMSAAEIAEELGVARQRVHQLRSTAAFPAPLAELRGGAVWDAAAVRKFAREWQRKPGRPVGRSMPRVTYRSSDGRLVDLDYLASIGLSLTKADIDSMLPGELERVIAKAEKATADN